MKIESLPLSQKLRLLENVKPVALETPGVVSSGSKTEGQSFADFFLDKLKDVNDTAIAGEQKLEAHIAGKVANPHETYIALQKADISFQLLMQVKRQIQQAYQMIIRTPIG